MKITELNSKHKTEYTVPIFRISVRHLVEFLLRGGDIDSRLPQGVDQEAALAGAKLHRKIQKSMAKGYSSEVSLVKDTVFDEFVIRIEGRADGIIVREEDLPAVTIDEIKGMYLDVTELEEPFPLHLAQAKCYAAIYSELNEINEIGVQMTYGNLDTEEIKRFFFRFQAEGLKDWYETLIGEFSKWVRWDTRHRNERNLSMQNLEFPFPYREGQKKLTAAVYHTIKEGNELFLMAPTGVGKTMATVYPSVRALGEGIGDKIFYLTAKNETRAVGMEAFRILIGKGLTAVVILLTSKERICPRAEVRCNPDECPFAKGHFDRVNDAVYELLTSDMYIDRETILAQSRKYTVCPFELTLDLATWSDAIVCDYNYVFDPNVKLQRFFSEGTKGHYIFLIDEAHNLVERGRDMYSAALVKEHVLSAKRLLNHVDKPCERALGRVNKMLLELKHISGDLRMLTPAEAEPFLQEVLRLREVMSMFFKNSKDSELKEKLLDFYFEVRDFVTSSELMNDDYAIYTETNEDDEFRMRLFCINPAEMLTDCIHKGKSAVFFSATLLPIDYYKELLSKDENPYAVYARSPFDTGKRKLLIGLDASTKYTSRGPDEYRKMASYIYIMARMRKGNYLAFFPSYKLLRDVFDIFRTEYDDPEVNWVVQSPMMQEDDREIFLENFYEEPEHSLVGFAVMGGMFSEGIDLTGTRLIGAAVIGCGIPQVSNERKVLKDFYDEKGKNGFDYAYRFPGMNKVQQSAGRVIRTDSDTGVILIIDSRLRGSDYRRLFPREWSDAEYCNLTNVQQKLSDFWNSLQRK